MAAAIKIGTIFAGYRIEGVLGRGGMGVVYLAEQPELGRKVAIKVIAPALASDPDYLQRFRRESRLAAAIEHPNSIPIYEAGVADEEMPYLVMRYVEGEDLSSLIRREGKLDPRRAASIVDQIAGALDEAHARGLVHRDVKPANVIVESRRGTEHAYLTDFGLTREMDASSGVTATGRWVGTIDYASPEQIKGRPVDARCDVYALGCLLFTALTGRLPFERAEDVAKLYAHVSEPPPAPSEVADGVSEELDGVIERAMAKDPDERFPSAGDLGRASLAAATGIDMAEPEHSVATGEAAPETQPDSRTAARIASTVETAPPPTEPASTVDVGAAPPTGPPTQPPEPPAQGKPGRRRGVAALAAVLVVGAAVAIGVIALGGGSDTGGGGGSSSSATGGDGGGSGKGSSGIDFMTFEQPHAFTVDVPQGWKDSVKPQEKSTVTVFQSPNADMRAQVQQEEDTPAQDRADQARTERSIEPSYQELAFGPRTVGSRRAVLLAYTHDEPAVPDVAPKLGPATVYNYFFNDGNFGWRTRVAVTGTDRHSEDVANEIATRMAATLTPTS